MSLWATIGAGIVQILATWSPLIVAWILRRKDKVEAAKRNLQSFQADIEREALDILDGNADGISRRAHRDATILHYLFHRRRLRRKTKPTK